MRQTGGGSLQEIIYSYQLVLGREPEPEALLTKAAYPLREALGILLNSDEFAQRVMNPIVRGRPPRVERPICSPALKDWVKATLPLSRAGRRELQSIRTWIDLIYVVFSDPTFCDYLLDACRTWREAGFVAALRERLRSASRALVGAVEIFDGVRVSGWAMDAGDLQRRLRLEVYVDGILVGRGDASVMRADIRDIYAIPGLCGFAIDLSSALLYARGGVVRVEVREEATGHLIGERTAEMGPDGQFDMVRDAEHAQAAAGLADLEEGCSGDMRAASYPLEAYAAYYRRVYGSDATDRRAVSDGPRLGIIALIQEDGGRSEGMLHSIIGLSNDAWELTLVGERTTLCEDWLASILANAGRTRVRLFEYDPTLPIAGQLNAAAAATGGEFLLIANQVVFAADALNRLKAAVRGNPLVKLIYWDEDEVDPFDAAGCHQSPRFKNPFDPVWLVQQNYIGDSFAIDRALFEQVGGIRDGVEGVGFHDLLLRATARSGRSAVHHIERVLHSRRAGAGPYLASLVAASDYLRCTGWPAIAEPCADMVGVARTDMLRILPDLNRVSATVIIASRDKPDLLDPCITSLLDVRKANRVAFDIIVVDHASVLPETLAHFRRLRAEGVEVRRYDGPFNWAAINNWGAKGRTADVLVFLNDDTLALAPGWCDELCLHAMRPDVGAVGTRLLYPDDSVQHAGMLLHSDGATPHEGLGLMAADGGYLDRFAVARDVAAVTGACLATRRSVFEAHGGFDAASFPVTYNDVDYCTRVRESGLAVRYTPYAGFYHFESKSRGFDVTPERRARHERERRTFIEKWPRLAKRDPFYNVHFDRHAEPHRRLITPPARAERIGAEAATPPIVADNCGHDQP